jgi:hypothetical protein
MTSFDGSLARQLDFGEMTTTSVTSGAGSRAALRLARPSGALRGPDKYRVFESRRRQAQIKARRLLDIVDEVEGGGLNG